MATTPSPHHFTSTSTVRKRSQQEKSSWYFLTVQQDVSEQIKEIAAKMPRKGRGSVRVKARIGWMARETSIFPEKKSGSYLLPIKAHVRKETDIDEGSVVTVFLEIV